MASLTVLLTLLPFVLSDLHQVHPHDETPSSAFPPPRPYAFGYAAGRYPGHIDRTHSEVSDGSGTVHGSYSYVDPSQRIRTVEYTADSSGFHATDNFPAPAQPADTPVVARAKIDHLRRFAAIASRAGPAPADTNAVRKAKDAHAALYRQIAETHARMAAELEALNARDYTTE